MKAYRCALLLALVLAVPVSDVFAATEIVLDDVRPFPWGDTLYADCAHRFTFRLTNDTNGTVTGFTHGFRVWTESGGSYTDHFEPVWVDTLPLGWHDRFDGFFSDIHQSVDGVGEDTVGFGGWRITGPGFPPGFSEQVWSITTIAYGHGDTLCIDSSWMRPGDLWVWATTLGSFQPDWLGPYCYDVLLFPCYPPDFLNCPDFVGVRPNDTVQLTLLATDLYRSSSFFFDQIRGPGSITQVDDSSVTWTYTAAAEDVCTQQSVSIQVWHDCNCEQCDFELYVTNGTIDFIGGCNDTAEINAGMSASIAMASTTDTCSSSLRFIRSVNREPAGSYFIDTSGSPMLVSDPADRGHYTFEVCVTNGPDTSCCDVVFFVHNDVCLNRGNADGDCEFGCVTVADLSYLVGYLFLNGPPPACEEEGNADNDCTFGCVTVSDLSYLVDYLFGNGPAPPPCP